MNHFVRVQLLSFLNQTFNPQTLLLKGEDRLLRRDTHEPVGYWYRYKVDGMMVVVVVLQEGDKLYFFPGTRKDMARYLRKYSFVRRGELRVSLKRQKRLL